MVRWQLGLVPRESLRGLYPHWAAGITACWLGIKLGPMTTEPACGCSTSRIGFHHVAPGTMGGGVPRVDVPSPGTGFHGVCVCGGAAEGGNFRGKVAGPQRRPRLILLCSVITEGRHFLLV